MTGSTAEGLPLQLSELKLRLEEDQLVLRGDRVLVTLLIGANDLCMWDCRRPEFQLESFQSHLFDFLNGIIEHLVVELGAESDILLAEIPALEGVPSRAKGTIMEPFALLECPCAYHPDKSYDFRDRINRYNQVIHDLVTESPARIMISSVLRTEELEDWPGNMTSKLDAFHPSKQAHSYFAQKIFTEMEGIII